MQRIKSYKFWLALSASVVIFIKVLKEMFNFEIDENLVDKLIMSFCGVLVVLGIVEKPVEKKDETNEDDKDLQK